METYDSWSIYNSLILAYTQAEIANLCYAQIWSLFVISANNQIKGIIWDVDESQFDTVCTVFSLFSCMYREMN